MELLEKSAHKKVEPEGEGEQQEGEGDGADNKPEEPPEPRKIAYNESFWADLHMDDIKLHSQYFLWMSEFLLLRVYESGMDTGIQSYDPESISVGTLAT